MVMYRREVLSVAGVAGIFLAGCTDANLLDESQDPSEEQSSSGGSQASDQSTNDRATRERLLETYNNGIRERNDAVSNRENGVSAWNNDNYSTAERRFSSAESEFRGSRSQFQDAQDLAYEVDNRDAQEFCDVAIEHCSYMIEAMRASQRMASAGGDQDVDRANTHLETVREAESNAERMNLRSVSALESVLNLN